jgi:hypothetical protein
MKMYKGKVILKDETKYEEKAASKIALGFLMFVFFVSVIILFSN